MAIVRQYNLRRVQVTLGPLRVEGWADGDVIVLSSESEGFNAQASTDGTHVMISKDNNPIWMCTLKVKRNTEAARRMSARRDLQFSQADNGLVDDLPFQVYDPSTGTKFSEKGAFFSAPPDVTFGAETPDIEFELILPSPTYTVDAGVPLNQ